MKNETDNEAIEELLVRSGDYLMERTAQYREQPVHTSTARQDAPRRYRRVLAGTAAAATLGVTAFVGGLIGQSAPKEASIAKAMDQSLQPLPSSGPYTSLPGGARFMGLTPECRQLEATVYECSIAKFPESARVTDMTGYVNFFVDKSEHVTGGCRVINPYGTKLMCYLGSTAVEQEIIAPSFLGEWVYGGKAEG